jgi:hypothetical protein
LAIEVISAAPVFIVREQSNCGTARTAAFAAVAALYWAEAV